jgi:hypothetical protein
VPTRTRLGEKNNRKRKEEEKRYNCSQPVVDVFIYMHRRKQKDKSERQIDE